MHEVERKLQKKEVESPILVINMPEELQRTFQAFHSPVVEVLTKEIYTTIMVFGLAVEPLQRETKKVLDYLSHDGLLWVCYPKKSSKKYKDSNCGRNELIGLLAKEGFETVRQVAINEDWSAIRYRDARKIKTMKRKFAVSDEGKQKVKSNDEKS